MSSSRRSSISNLNIEEPTGENTTTNGGSRKTLLIFSGVLAVVAVVTLCIALPVYYANVEDPKTTTAKTKTDPAITTPGVITVPTADTTATAEPTSTTDVVPVEVPENEKVDCYPDNSTATAEMCIERGCTWTGASLTSPSCVYRGASMYGVEGVTNTSPSGKTTMLSLSNDGASQNQFGAQFETLTLKTTYISDSTLRIKIYPSENRFEVPIDHPPTINYPEGTALFTVDHTDDGNVVVMRESTSTVLFNTSVGELMFADQYLQISTSVASEYVYGFGEHMHLNFKHDMNWKRFGMFSRDQGVGADVNLYGVHPYFTCMEGDGNAYGVYFVNSNAMDVTLQPNPAITYRTVGGVLDFYIFLGPTPEEVTSQYTDLIGRPYFPPYWAFGFQLSRYGYENLENLTRVFERNVGKIPYDVQYSDIDYMERQLDFTIDPVAYDGLENFVKDVKNNYSMRYIIILDPAISGNETAGTYPPFEDGVRDGVFIKTPDGDIAWGKVWPDYPNITVDDTKPFDYQTENYRAYTAFPDFSLPATEQWWIKHSVLLHDRIEFDGLWIDMNEPASFVAGSPDGCPEDNMLDNPPYVPDLASGALYDKTICMSNKQYNPLTKTDTDHYNMHSLYGWSQTLPTLRACRNSTGERCIIISRSTYPGSGKYVGHWLGDNTSIWEHLRTSIIGMLEFNLFGIPYIGADVCGFFVDTTEELCRRWMQLGAFYPFDRNHNGINWADQDPGFFGEQFLIDSKKVLDLRYSLLPYLYTLFYEAHQTGATVVRPMMHQFPMDMNAYTIDRQFLWGPALLVTPVLDEGQTSVEGYFPNGRWFDHFTGNVTEAPSDGIKVVLDTPMDHINVHYYGGHIIPTQEPALTTFESRKNPFGLVVALDNNMMASGSLFWDDGSSIDTITKGEYNFFTFNCQNNVLMVTPDQISPNIDEMVLGSVRILGLNSMVSSVSVNSMVYTDFTQMEGSYELVINNLATVMTTTLEISWSFVDIDCFPETYETVNKTNCEARGCVYLENNSPGPSCLYRGQPVYSLGSTSETNSGITSTLTASPDTLTHFGEHVQDLTVETSYVSSTALRIKIFPTDTSNNRFEVPMDHPVTIDKPSDALYNVEHTSSGDRFGVKVERASKSRVLFDTSVGELMFTDQFLQVTTRVGSEYVYGFGEHMHLNFKHDMNWKKFGMFSRDQGVGADVNLYGVHPYFMCMEGDGDAYGVFFVNSNAMDITLEPTPAITYRTVGGILDFYIFLGPTPEEVTSQYTEVIGRPYFPPYWSLGFQLSRYGYENLENLTKVFNRNIGKIPYEVQYSDIDYMERQLDFTIDPVAYDGLEEFVQEVKNNYNMKYIIIFDPAISGNETAGTYPPFDQGVTDDVFIKTPSGNIAWGKVWPDYPNITVDETQPWDYQTENYRAYAAFPDFGLPKTEEWWTDLTVDFYKRIEFDGLWIDMNEPASFVAGSPDGCPESSNWDNPPYMPNLASGSIYDKTICMQNIQYNPGTMDTTEHYNMHSLYGISQALPTLNACRASTGERCIVISRSTYPGSGKYVGHWLGDNASIWEHLRTSIIGMLEFNLFGIPYIGADVCGFFVDTTEELCRRWMQLGAFYPFDRNHNGINWADQDPGFFGEQFLIDSKKVLDLRYSLLPYLYTLFYEAHQTGATVVRPMMNQFPMDINTFTIDRQFLWGPALLVTPVLDEGQTTVEGYFPNGRWFDHFTGDVTEAPSDGIKVVLDTPMDHINVHYYGGHIIPTQEPALTTFESRKNPFGLIVALDSNMMASGSLFWDDGSSIDTITKGEYNFFTFNCNNNVLMVSADKISSNINEMVLGSVRVLGLNGSVLSVSVDGMPYTNFTQMPGNYELVISNLAAVMNTTLEISWSLVDAIVDCFPEIYETVTKTNCEARGCVYSENNSPRPSCLYTGQPVYSLGSTTETISGISSTLTATPDTLTHYGEHVQDLTVETSYVSSTALRIKIFPSDTSNNRFEVPMDHPASIDKPSDALYNVEHTGSGGRLGVKVERASKSRVLFDTSAGELMFTDQFLQVTTRVASEYVYGFGEHMHLNFKHNMNWKRFGMFSRDQGVGADVNLYGVHPYFMCMEGDGDAYGVFFVNSNAMDVTLEPTPAVTYRTVGGILDFYIFLGPTPEEVTSQYTEVIGRPYFPPYWSLGFQLSRYGYGNLDNLTKVFNRNIGKIPYEVQYSDIDYMERQLDFTIDPVAYDGLEEFVQEVKNDHNMKYIIIFDPAISGNETAGTYPPFDQGVMDDIFIKAPGGGISWGKVWPDYPNITVDETQPWDYQTENYRAYTAFPDFGLPKTEEWWTDLTVDFYKRIEFDGLWIDMNEPASFVAGSPDGCPESSNLDNPPYMPNLASGKIYDKTICMQSIQHNPGTMDATEHYNMHSLYGISQALPTLNACRASTGERCIVISRSTYPGSGKYVGHWLGDNTSIWEHLRTSIIGMLEFNLFGIPYIGADVCGFFVDTTEELCRRWMQLGAFYPFDRNHNGINWADQDPGFFGEQFLIDSKKVLDVRYTLLPYLYTLFYEAHMTGATVVRPMMNQFPNDVNTYQVDRQLLWGPSLLITPVLDEGQTSVSGYFPYGRWYDYYTGKQLETSGVWNTLDAPMDHINVHVYGGSITPTQEPALTTFESRQNPFGLIVALDDDGIASGKFFWDDGKSIETIESMEYTYVEFSCATNTLINTVNHTNLAVGPLMLSSVRILGVPAVATRVVIDGTEHQDFVHNPDTLELTIQGINGVFINQLFEIKWEINSEWKRVDCMPSKSSIPTESECLSRGCQWDGSSYCFYQLNTTKPSYKVTTTNRDSTTSYTMTRDGSYAERYGTPVEALTVDAEMQTENRLHFKIKDASGNSFEIPEYMHNFPKTTLSDETLALYEVEVTEDPFSMVVKRKSTGKIIFDTSVGPLVYEEKYREISTSLPSPLVFGLGEHNHQRYRHNFNWKRWAIFTRDVAPIDEWNFYGHQTFYMAVDDIANGTAIGVYFHNANAMDVTFSPDPMLTYRTTGGVLDFYIFLGNSQEELVQQYHALVGPPVMPPYWGLGFQLSRWGYQSLDEIKGIYSDTRAAKIPYDIQYADIEYMEAYKSFTYDKVNFAGLPEFVDELHDNGMRFLIILDPGIKVEPGYKAYDDGLEQDIFIKDPTGGKPVVTEVWPGETLHPDYTHPNATSWWYEQCQDFYFNSKVEYDALWIDMNEPANFQPDDPVKLENMNCSDEYNRLPFMPNILGYWNGLHDKTICMENQQYDGLHFDVHSLYGHTMTLSTFETLKELMPDKRSFVVTRATFAGTGKYAGHWLGDNQSQWRQLPWPIPAMIEFNLFGFAWVGADVCGFYFNTTEEMCMRWTQVGAFYPFSRNHNAKDMIDQHPTAFDENFVNATREILEIRYDILPYMYTKHYEASTYGGTVVRALVHEFPSDRNAWDADGQFLLGNGFLITPVLMEGKTSVTGYFPGESRWYDYRTGKELTPSGRFVLLDAPLEYINLHVRGGVIFPKQNHDVTTTLARKNPMSLLVALDQSGEASGSLYWDDGEARIVEENYLLLDFNCQMSNLTISVRHTPTGDLDVSSLHFEQVVVYGLTANVSSVEADGTMQNQYNYADNVLSINDLSLGINNSHYVYWN